MKRPLYLLVAVSVFVQLLPTSAASAEDVTSILSALSGHANDIERIKRALTRITTHLGLDEEHVFPESSTATANHLDVPIRKLEDMQGVGPGNNTRISTNYVKTSNAYIANDLHVAGDVYISGQFVYSGFAIPVENMFPAPSPAPTFFSCSTEGIYASFELSMESKCPLVHYDMSTMEGGQIKDLIGSNNLVIQGSPTSDAVGAVGTTYQMSTSSDYFWSVSAYPSALTGTYPKSLALWAYISSPGVGDGDNCNVLGSFGSSSGCAGNAFGIYCAASDRSLNLVGCSMDLGVSVAASGNPDLCSLNTWHHYIISFDGSVAYIYFDGALVASGALGLNTQTYMDKIGIGIDTWHRGTEHHLSTGRVDEVKLYNYVLSVSEAAQLYALRS